MCISVQHGSTKPSILAGLLAYLDFLLACRAPLGSASHRSPIANACNYHVLVFSEMDFIFFLDLDKTNGAAEECRVSEREHGMSDAPMTA